MNSPITSTAKSPELSRVREESDAALKALDEVVNQLTACLLEVMSPSRPSENKGKSEPKYYSKLAQDIDAHNDGIWLVVNSIKSVIERLEI